MTRLDRSRVLLLFGALAGCGPGPDGAPPDAGTSARDGSIVADAWTRPSDIAVTVGPSVRAPLASPVHPLKAP